MSSTPDVCKTPTPAGTVPIPYVTVFMCNMALPNTACSKVFIAGALALNVKSQTAVSNGDEAGNAGGVVSSKFIGKGEFLGGSQKVTLEGKAAVSQGASTKHNDGNTVGLCSASAQSKVDVG